MARKSNKNDHYPVVRSGRVFRQSPPTAGRVEVNIEQFLSKTNRRLYRQSRNYHVKLDADPDSTQTYNVYALADTWMVEKALKMGYDMYLLRSESARDRLKGNSVARWEDFRVQSGVTAQNLNPMQFNLAGAGFPGVELVDGEFSLTEVIDNAGVTRTFTWDPIPSGGTYSLLDQYDKAGDAQPSPTTVTGDMPYDNLMADDSQAMAFDLQQRGNLPPYDADGVNGDYTWVRVAQLSAAGPSQKLSSGFFTAPCGFVVVTVGGGTEETIVDETKLSWSVKSGDYKGVHAPSMVE